MSHGGNNTVNETLAAPRPLLVLPVGGERGDNASRVVHLGAGLRTDIRSFRTAEIRAKVERLLDEPSFRERATRVALVLGQADGSRTAARRGSSSASPRPANPSSARRATPSP